MHTIVRACALFLWLAATALIGAGCAFPGQNAAPGSQAGGAAPNGSGVTITLRAQTEKLAGRNWTDADLEATRQIVERRGHLTTAGVSRVSAVSPDRIVLSARRMPTAAELARLSAPNDLRFYFIPQLESGAGGSPPHWSVARNGTSKEGLLDSLSGKAITDAELDKAVFGRRPDLATQDFLPNFRPVITSQGLPVLEFRLKPDSADRIALVERHNINRHLAIFLDRKLITVPVLRAPFDSMGVIEGAFTADEARAIADQLNTGALPVPLVQVPSTPGTK